MRKILVMLLMSAVVITACSQPTASQPAGGNTVTPPSKTPGVPLQWSTPPAMTIDQSKTYTAVVDTTLGSFTIQLFPTESPKAVNNFVFLSQQGFYGGVIFHRIIKAFMIQGGDPTGTGSGSPGYTFAEELPPKHPYSPGIVAMARTSQPNSQGSQFFICTGADAAGPPPNYTQFGQVVSGMDVVQKIAAVPVGASSSGEPSRPLNPPVINKVTITVQ